MVIFDHTMADNGNVKQLYFTWSRTRFDKSSLFYAAWDNPIKWLPLYFQIAKSVEKGPGSWQPNRA